MSDYITFPDISYAQGLYNMASDAAPICEMKMTGFYYGSKLPYTDVQGARNYADAEQYGKIPLLYHFAGGADPVVEANYFVNVGCMPFRNGDTYELDYELTAEMNPPADPDSWCRAFADQVKARTGKYPILYTNTSTFLANNKFPKTMEVCALIIADYRYTPDQNVPCGHPYIIQQFTDTPIDTNALFIPLDVFRKYGYESPATIQTPTPTPPTIASPTPPAPQAQQEVTPSEPAQVTEPAQPSTPVPVEQSQPTTPAPVPSEVNPPQAPGEDNTAAGAPESAKAQTTQAVVSITPKSHAWSLRAIFTYILQAIKNLRKGTK